MLSNTIHGLGARGRESFFTNIDKLLHDTMDKH